MVEEDVRLLLESSLRLHCQFGRHDCDYRRRRERGGLLWTCVLETISIDVLRFGCWTSAMCAKIFEIGFGITFLQQV